MESIIVASNKDMHLRSLIFATKGTRAERYPIHSGKTSCNPALIASGSQLMNHDAYTGARVLHEIHPQSLCVGIQSGIIKTLNRLFLLHGIVFILPDETEVIVQTSTIELKNSKLVPYSVDEQTYYFRWSQVHDPEFPQETLFAHSANSIRMESLTDGFRLAINQINWNKFPSSPPQPLQHTTQ